MEDPDQEFLNEKKDPHSGIVVCEQNKSENKDSNIYPCSIHLECDIIFENQKHLSSHSLIGHSTLPKLQPPGRNPAKQTEVLSPCNEIISFMDGDHYTESLQVLIHQLDGNDSMPEDNDEYSTVGLTENEIYALDPTLIESGYTIVDTNPSKSLIDVDNTMNTFSSVNTPSIRKKNSLPIQSSDHISYQYTLNKDNQTQRLLANANKVPMNITYNNFIVLNGKKHATNVNIEFNAGVYMSAIKPALEAIHEGWKTVVLGTNITCNNISDRMDNSGSLLVCTQLTLTLANHLEGITGSKVVLHLYHTDDKLQIQGSHLLNKVSTAVWTD